jgi:hemerythrin-like domain-containing protein
MDPFETLSDEHSLIERMLAALWVYAARIDEADPADLASFVVFFTEMVEGRHHAKEEMLLFEAMIEAGFPRRTGPLATMMREHDDARRLVLVLGEAARRAGAWTLEDRARIASTTYALVQLLRKHMQKEDDIIYPMARHNLPPEAVMVMAARFAEIDGTAEARAERTALRVLAEILTARYGGASMRRPEYMAAAAN